MNISIEYDTKSGKFKLSLIRNVYITLGLGLFFSGLALLFDPLWLILLSGVMEKAHIEVNTIYSRLGGIFCILLGLSLIAYKMMVFDEIDKKIKTDFNSITNANLPFEEIQNYFFQLKNDDSYYSSCDTNFAITYTYFLNPVRKLLYPKTNYLYQEFSASAQELHKFVSINFTVFPNTSTANPRYCLLPDLNVDRSNNVLSPQDSSKYANSQMQLYELVDDVKHKFDDFLSHLHNMGHLNYVSV